ncbi:hypothetical protein DFH09DRAFT_1164496 [Mycena vulgaris]|nr:hypothetical protein DFH09DRAFT_1164496 [Mycena vulgaris]
MPSLILQVSGFPVSPFPLHSLSPSNSSWHSAPLPPSSLPRSRLSLSHHITSHLRYIRPVYNLSLQDPFVSIVPARPPPPARPPSPPRICLSFLLGTADAARAHLARSAPYGRAARHICEVTTVRSPVCSLRLRAPVGCCAPLARRAPALASVDGGCASLAAASPPSLAFLPAPARAASSSSRCGSSTALSPRGLCCAVSLSPVRGSARWLACLCRDVTPRAGGLTLALSADHGDRGVQHLIFIFPSSFGSADSLRASRRRALQF